MGEIRRMSVRCSIGEPGLLRRYFIFNGVDDNISRWSFAINMAFVLFKEIIYNVSIVDVCMVDCRWMLLYLQVSV